jgi:hypothetical protein
MATSHGEAAQLTYSVNIHWLLRRQRMDTPVCSLPNGEDKSNISRRGCATSISAFIDFFGDNT